MHDSPVRVAVSTGQRNTIIFNLKDGVLYMTYRTRIKYTPEQKADIWNRWEKGESLKSIGRLFDRPSSSIFNMLVPTGGIRPPVRKRSRLALTLSFNF